MPTPDITSRPLATIEPATSRWINEATARHTITLGVYTLLLAAGRMAGVNVDWRTFAVMLLWIGTNLVMAPWAARPHDFATRLRRYACTLAVDVAFLGAVYVFLDAAQWIGAVFFMHSALVASATLPRRWAMTIAAFIVVVWSVLVLLSVAGPIVVASPLGLSPVRGNYIYALASITATFGLIAVLMLLQARLVETIRDAEQRYLLVVQSAPDMVMTFDESGRFLDVNPATLEQTGYTWREIKELPNTGFFPPEDWPKILAARERTATGETVTMEVRYVRKNGETRWVETTSAPFRRAGEPGSLLVIARDITASRQQTDELRANQHRFRMIVDALDLGFYTIDTGQRITAIIGRWAEEQVSHSRVLLGKGAYDLLPPDVAAQHQAANARALAGEDVTIRWTSPPVAGQPERFIRTHLAPMRDGDGQVVGAVGVWTDETEAVTLERERETLRSRVADTERIESLGKLVSGVAHELNNPLAAILNFTEDLLVDARPDDERIALEVIQSQALRSRTIVRDLLTFVRKGDRRPRKIETPGPVLETLIRAVRPGFATQGVAFTATTTDDATPLLMDRAGFEQVVTNLLTNAAQAAGAGGTVRLLAQRDGDAYDVIVEDNGAGISEAHFARIFEPFFTTKPTGQGVGLGLSVSLGIVQAHGGFLGAENRSAELGGGARFTMRLPVAVDALVGLPAMPPISRRTPSAPMPPVRSRENSPADPMHALRPPRLPSLLIIDDEESIRRALRRYFERRGWAVDEAQDGTEALVKLLRRDANVLYDVVLCDLKMPGTSGPELYRRLEVESPAMARRMILSTGDVSAPDVAAFLSGVTVPVLEKPFELATLEGLAEKVRHETAGAAV